MPGIWGTFTWGSQPWGGGVISVEEASHVPQIYEMLLLGVRNMDNGGNGLIKKICDILDIAWEDLIYDPCSNLPTLFDIDLVEDKWLPYLKPILGFTKDLSFDATPFELRRILRQAMSYWNSKPSENALNDAIRMVTGNRFCVANFFDFRMQTDSTMLIEDLENLDPNLIDFPFRLYTGNKCVVTGASTFRVDDLPMAGFTNSTEFAWLAIINDSGNPNSPDNVGIYKVKSLTVAGTTGEIHGVFNYGAYASNANWRLLGYAGDMTTEVRLVDDGNGTMEVDAVTTPFTDEEKICGSASGALANVISSSVLGDITTLTLKNIKGRFIDNEAIIGDVGGGGKVKGGLIGVLNRNLLSFLIGDGDSNDTILPLGERVDLIYIDFLDQFISPGDLDQWTVISGVTVPSPGGYALISSTGYIRYIHPTNEWKTQLVVYKILVDSGETSLTTCKFLWQDATTFYYVSVNYQNKLVTLGHSTAGALDSKTLPILQAGVQTIIRLDYEQRSGINYINIYIDGNKELSASHSAPALSYGGIEVLSQNGPTKLKLVQVITLPVDVQRIGPNP